MRGFTMPPAALFLVAVLVNLTLMGRLLINFDTISTTRPRANEEEAKNQPNESQSSSLRPPLVATRAQLQHIRRPIDGGDVNYTSTIHDPNNNKTGSSGGSSPDSNPDSTVKSDVTVAQIETSRASKYKTLKLLVPQTRNISTNHTRHSDGTAKNQSAKVESSSYDAQSQDGIDHDHMGRDGQWAGDLPELLGCPTISSNFAKSEDPMAYNYIPNKDSHWNHFIKAYHSTIDPNHSVIPFDQYNESAWAVPIEVKFSKKDGRGVYTKVDISKGTKVWDADYHTAVFNTSHAYRAFLEHLIADNTTKRAACDCQIWVDIAPKPENSEDDSRKRHKRKEYQICQTFDEAVLFNTREAKKQNLKSVEKDASNPCGAYYYIATKDITAGEQLLISYSEGSGGSKGWKALGMY